MSRHLIASCTIALSFALAGCNGPMGNPSRGTSGLVPEGAELAASGKAGIAHFTAGGVTVYIVDETDRSLLFSGQIPDDSPVVIRIDADAGAVVAVGPGSEDDAESATVLAKPIDTTHRFSIWTSGQESSGTGAATRSIEISE